MYWASIPTVAFLAFSRDVTNSPTYTKRCSSLSLSSTTTSANGAPGTSTPEKYGRLIEWIKSKEGVISEKIEIRPSSRGGGYGAFVTEPINEGDVLFTVPRSACLTLEDATEDPECGEKMKKLIEKAGPGADTAVMAGYMAKEYLELLEDIKNDNEKESRWGPYFQTLPWKRGDNEQEHILFWSEDMIDSLLAGSVCYEEANGLTSEVDLAVQVMNQIVGKKIRAARGEEIEEGFSWPWEAKSKEPDDIVEGFPEAVKGAFVSLLTRSFQDGEGDEEKLVPMLDLLQHSDNPNIRHAMRKSDGMVEVFARRQIEADEELLNQYRPEEEDTMPYSRFFTRFGFVPGISEPIENLLQDKSTIFFPQKAEI